MNIARWLLLALLSLPILEIYLLIKVGGIIGFLPTLLLLFGAASLGTYLLQTQGWSTWMRLQQSWARGDLPAAELLDGAIILAGAALFVLPGFFSDLLGLLCLIPATRRMIAANLIRTGVGLRPGTPRDRQGPRTIEGEYRRED
jgi:UPF0716 protein FxsA